MRPLACLALLLAACATSPRFADTPIVWHDDDTRSIEAPEARKYVRPAYWIEVYGSRRLTRVLEFRGQRPAMNTNALDELPNSTWFTNRIGVRDVPIEEAVTASSGSGPPVPPLVALRGKAGGTRPGFMARDQTGRMFLVKFDFAKNPDQQTGTGVIANRLFWTIGYNVPSEHFVDVNARTDVVVSDEAKVDDEFGRKRAMTRDDLDAMFLTAPRRADGSYRLFASELLSGTPIGGVSPEGTRPDDLNDTVPHEHRRELRGLRVFAAWLGHTDVKEDNTLDMYEQHGDRGFVRHYLVDLNECFGTHQSNAGRLEDGWEYNVDWEMQLYALLALGLWKRPWEDQTQTPWPVIGAFSAEHFDPEKWRPAFPYFPFFETTAADAYWAAKIVMRFDRPLLEALVETGGWDDEPSAYLVDTLLERQRKVGATYLDAVTSLDSFTIEYGQICAHDLAAHYGLAPSGVVERLGPSGKVRESLEVGPDAKVCWQAVQNDDYVVDRLRVRRPDGLRPAMELHYRGGPAAHVVGIVRTSARRRRR